MKRNWKDIEWIFEPDGSLIDIYVQEVSMMDWERIIDLINEKFEVNHGNYGEYQDSKIIDKEYAIEYLTDKTGEKESKSASIELKGLKLNCHFFLEDQIEFDIDPKEINSIEDFEQIEMFMSEISRVTENQVILTGENNITFPLFKIDFKNRINKILTEEEAQSYWGNPDSFSNKFKLFKTKLKLKLSSNKFKEKILKSANEPYKSAKKDENVW
jgi:hypothetical protein